MIKKYLEFIKESSLEEIKAKHHSIGEYIESIAGDDEYALNIISQYTKDIDPTIRLANAINLLDEKTQEFILKMIEDNRSGNEEQKEPEVSAYTGANLSESTEQGGKNLFKCFLKTLTALGLKDTNINWSKTPDDYIMCFVTNDISVQNVKLIMTRYRQFDLVVNSIDYKHNECQLYYGIKVDGTFQYGIKTEDQNLVIGKFKITKGLFNWLLVLDSPSASNLKKTLISFDLGKIILLGRIKTEMSKFNPGETQHRNKPEINGDVITFAYQGVGKWNGPQMDNADFESIRSNFKSFLSKYKWADLVQVSVTANQYWLYLNIKIK